MAANHRDQCGLLGRIIKGEVLINPRSYPAQSLGEFAKGTPISHPMPIWGCVKKPCKFGVGGVIGERQLELNLLLL